MLVDCGAVVADHEEQIRWPFHSVASREKIIITDELLPDDRKIREEFAVLEFELIQGNSVVPGRVNWNSLVLDSTGSVIKDVDSHNLVPALPKRVYYAYQVGCSKSCESNGSSLTNLDAKSIVLMALFSAKAAGIVPEECRAVCSEMGDVGYNYEEGLRAVRIMSKAFRSVEDTSQFPFVSAWGSIESQMEHRLKPLVEINNYNTLVSGFVVDKSGIRSLGEGFWNLDQIKEFGLELYYRTNGRKRLGISYVMLPEPEHYLFKYLDKLIEAFSVDKFTFFLTPSNENLTAPLRTLKEKVDRVMKGIKYLKTKGAVAFARFPTRFTQPQFGIGQNLGENRKLFFQG